MTMTPTDRVARIFNGTYTVTSPDGTEHKTFRIHTQPVAETQRKRGKADPFAPGKRIISLLAGPDNTSDYKGFGFVDDNGISVWRKHRSNGGAKTQHEKYAAMVWSLAVDGERSFFHLHGCRMLMSGTCIKCNRKLTTPESIRRGIGPICAGGGLDGGQLGIEWQGDNDE